jgi:Tat protein secretion system quality control protein TatD with DNase activity
VTEPEKTVTLALSGEKGEICLVLMEIAQNVAEIKGGSFEEVEAANRENVLELFSKIER